MLVKLLELKICHSSAMQSFCGRKAVLEINWEQFSTINEFEWGNKNQL